MDAFVCRPDPEPVPYDLLAGGHAGIGGRSTGHGAQALRRSQGALDRLVGGITQVQNLKPLWRIPCRIWSGNGAPLGQTAVGLTIPDFGGMAAAGGGRILIVADTVAIGEKWMLRGV
jgi:hypothetical protein